MSEGAASAAAEGTVNALSVGLGHIAGAVTAMTRGQWLAIALAVLLFFWVLGAYNRLVVLRKAVAAAWLQVAEALRRRHEATRALLAALATPLAAEQRALDALAQALAASEAASDTLGARPLLPSRATAWLAAEAAFGAAAARVTALVEAATRGDGESPLWAPALAAYRDADKRLPFVRQLFNDAAAAYDEALALFPTSLLTRLFGFGPAGRV